MFIGTCAISVAYASCNNVLSAWSINSVFGLAYVRCYIIIIYDRSIAHVEGVRDKEHESEY